MKKKYDYDVHRYTIAKLLETKDKKETPYFQQAIWLPEIKKLRFPATFATWCGHVTKYQGKRGIQFLRRVLNQERCASSSPFLPS